MVWIFHTVCFPSNVAARRGLAEILYGEGKKIPGKIERHNDTLQFNLISLVRSDNMTWVTYESYELVTFAQGLGSIPELSSSLFSCCSMTWLSDCLPEASCEEDQGPPDKGFFQNVSLTEFLPNAQVTGNATARQPRLATLWYPRALNQKSLARPVR